MLYTYTYTIILYIIIHILLLYILYLILYSSVLFFYLPFLLFPPLFFQYPLPPLFFSSISSSSSPIFILYVSVLPYTYLYSIISSFPYPLLLVFPSIYLQFSSFFSKYPKLTPHVLSEWMVEVCRFYKYVKYVCLELCSCGELTWIVLILLDPYPIFCSSSSSLSFPEYLSALGLCLSGWKGIDGVSE